MPRREIADDLPMAWPLAVRNALQRVNPFVRAVKTISANSQRYPNAYLEITDTGPAAEIAALMSFENTSAGEVSTRNLVISRHNNSTYRIPIISRLWEPLAYPLFFPHGTLGWGVVGRTADIVRGQAQNPADSAATTTQMWHYRARLLREPRFSIFGRLTCEYLVDMYTRDIENRLQYIRQNQERIRQEEDALLMGQDDIQPNENVYLPASFIGSRKWASEQVSDSLAIAAALGPPTFFITMTCNPDWPEITSCLRPGQRFCDVPIVVVRVFKQKLRILIEALKKMFADVGAPVYLIESIEFQKRGLPHAHILVKYSRDCISATDIDAIISAEMPDSPSDRLLVQKWMLHTHPSADDPPSKYCQKENDDGTRTCRFRYPQQIRPETSIDGEGRVTYRRRKQEDSMVVPHCLPLIRMMKCHINFEIAGTSHLFQYLFKYIHKGPDRAEYHVSHTSTAGEPASVEVIDEIADYWHARYLSAGEAAWRILGFRITYKDPAVTSIPIHLEDNIHNVRYHQRSADGSLSKLERYFLRPDGTFMLDDVEQRFEDITLTEFYTYFRLERYRAEDAGKPRYFQDRPNGTNAARMHVILRQDPHHHLARLQYVSPARGELFYLRLILINRPARGFEDARYLNGIPHATFQEAAIAMGLFTNDNEAIHAIAEAVSSLRTPRQIRVLFIHLLIHDCIPAPLAVWEQFHENMAYDFTLRNNGSVELGVNGALEEMAHYLSESGRSLEDYGLPQPTGYMAELTHEIRRWSGFEETLNEQADADLARFNQEQRALFDTVMSAIQSGRPLCLFTDGKAGTGKTTVINALCNRLRACHRVVLPTASSASAAQLYQGGRTVHSTFKVPVDERHEMLKSTIKTNSPRAELIREASLIVWDEAPMANKAVLGCVNEILCDIMDDHDRPFGGKVIVLLGDWRQTSPVIRNGSEAEVVAASIKSSPLWRHFTVHHLICPIRNAVDPEFSSWVNSIGDGAGPSIPLTGLNVVSDKNDIVNFVFPDHVMEDTSVCVKRSILAPTNRQVDAYNAIILTKVEGHLRTFFAADSLKESEDANLPPSSGILDYVMRHTPPGLPPHSVSIKVGAVCRLLRNFSIDRGLVKNVRVVVTDVGTRLITVRVIKSHGAVLEDDILIPRIIFETQLRSGHTLSRRQFPLAPAYATTFNSCQGLTLDRVGVDLTQSVFSHGQLYTAISRIRSRDHAIVLLPEGETETQNVTYFDLLA